MIQRVALFHGVRDTAGELQVLNDGRPLEPYRVETDAAELGFEWGSESAGSLLLARSLLAAVLNDHQAAYHLAPAYAAMFVDKIGVSTWVLPSSEVIDWVRGDLARAWWLDRN